VNYPYRTDREQATLDHLPSSPYASDNTPYLSTARYSIIGYEPRDVEDKRALDMSGAADNAYWYRKTKEDNLAINFGQR